MRRQIAQRRTAGVQRVAALGDILPPAVDILWVEHRFPPSVQVAVSIHICSVIWLEWWGGYPPAQMTAHNVGKVE